MELKMLPFNDVIQYCYQMLYYTSGGSVGGNHG